MSIDIAIFALRVNWIKELNASLGWGGRGARLPKIPIPLPTKNPRKAHTLVGGPFSRSLEEVEEDLFLERVVTVGRGSRRLPTPGGTLRYALYNLDDNNIISGISYFLSVCSKWNSYFRRKKGFYGNINVFYSEKNCSILVTFYTFINFQGVYTLKQVDNN